MNKIIKYLTVWLLLLTNNQIKAFDKPISDKDSLKAYTYHENLPEKYKALGCNIFFGYGYWMAMLRIILLILFSGN
ncbi:MAG: hypothetical protein Q8907_02040 [Bacteroidota bacterium]|nr:hypothetical protein [Bacteroidota bacterium]